MRMKLDKLPIGLYDENVYVLHDNGHVLVVDPGACAKKILSCISKDEVLDGIILTHGHEDHTAACDDLCDLMDCPVYMHEADYVLIDPNGSRHYGYDAPVYHEITWLSEGKMDIGSFPVTVYHTPGHTSGSVCVKYRNLLFSGDTLFASSIGRTDLFSGSEEEMISSLKFLMTLPKDLRVLPGHGPETTIGNEIMKNPYLYYLNVN